MFCDQHCVFIGGYTVRKIGIGMHGSRGIPTPPPPVKWKCILNLHSNIIAKFNMLTSLENTIIPRTLLEIFLWSAHAWFYFGNNSCVARTVRCKITNFLVELCKNRRRVYIKRRIFCTEGGVLPEVWFSWRVLILLGAHKLFLNNCLQSNPIVFFLQLYVLFYPFTLFFGRKWKVTCNFQPFQCVANNLTNSKPMFVFIYLLSFVVYYHNKTR